MKDSRSVYNKDFIFKELNDNIEKYEIKNLIIMPFIKLEDNILKYYYHLIDGKIKYMIFPKNLNLNHINASFILQEFITNFNILKKEIKIKFKILVYFIDTSFNKEYLIEEFLKNFKNIIKFGKIFKIQIIYNYLSNKINKLNFNMKSIKDEDFQFLENINKNNLTYNKMIFYKKNIFSKSIDLIYLNFYYILKFFLRNELNYEMDKIYFFLYFYKNDNNLYFFGYQKSVNLKHFKSNNKIKEFLNLNLNNIVFLWDNFFSYILKKYKFNLKNMNFIINPKNFLLIEKVNKIKLIKKYLKPKIINQLTKYLQLDYVNKEILYTKIEKNFILKKNNLLRERNNLIILKKKSSIKNKLIFKYNENNINKVIKNKIQKSNKSNNCSKDYKIKISKPNVLFYSNKNSIISQNKLWKEKNFSNNQFININYSRFNRIDILKDLTSFKKKFKRTIFSRGEIFNKNSYKKHSIPFLISNKIF